MRQPVSTTLKRVKIGVDSSYYLRAVTTEIPIYGVRVRLTEAVVCLHAVPVGR